MKIDESIQLSRDLDLFFLQDVDKERKSVHCATFGAILPEELNDEDYIVNCITQAKSTPLYLSDAEIEVEYDNVIHILGENMPEGLLSNEDRLTAYIRSFVNMARKGFWSYDRYHSPHSEPKKEDGRFLLVAHPKQFAKIPDNHYNQLRLCNSFTLVDDYKDINL